MPRYGATSSSLTGWRKARLRNAVSSCFAGRRRVLGQRRELVGVAHLLQLARQDQLFRQLFERLYARSPKSRCWPTGGHTVVQRSLDLDPLDAEREPLRFLPRLRRISAELPLHARLVEPVGRDDHRVIGQKRVLDLDDCGRVGGRIEVAEQLFAPAGAQREIERQALRILGPRGDAHAVAAGLRFGHGLKLHRVNGHLDVRLGEKEHPVAADTDHRAVVAVAEIVVRVLLGIGEQEALLHDLRPRPADDRGLERSLRGLHISLDVHRRDAERLGRGVEAVRRVVFRQQSRNGRSRCRGDRGRCFRTPAGSAGAGGCGLPRGASSPRRRAATSIPERSFAISAAGGRGFFGGGISPASSRAKTRAQLFAASAGLSSARLSRRNLPFCVLLRRGSRSSALRENSQRPELLRSRQTRTRRTSATRRRARGNGETPPLSHQPRHEISRDIRQPVVAAFVAVDQLLVIDAEAVEQRGVEIVDVDGVAGDVVAEVVGFAVDVAALECRRRPPRW